MASAEADGSASPAGPTRWDGAPGAGRGADCPRPEAGVEGGLARATGQGLGTCQRRCGDLRVPRPRDTGIRKSGLRNGSERARSRWVATERRFRAVIASAGCWPSRGGGRPPAPCAGLGSLVWARCMAPPHSALPQLREGEAVPSPARRTATGEPPAPMGPGVEFPQFRHFRVYKAETTYGSNTFDKPICVRGTVDYDTESRQSRGKRRFATPFPVDTSRDSYGSPERLRQKGASLEDDGRDTRRKGRYSAFFPREARAHLGIFNVRKARAEGLQVPPLALDRNYRRESRRGQAVSTPFGHQRAALPR